MTDGPVVRVDIDSEADAAYVRLSLNAVSSTEQFSEDINVDLDAMGVVVGIELLDLSVSIPLDDLTKRHHVDSTTLDLLLSSITMHAAATVSASSSSARPSSGRGVVEARETRRQPRPARRSVIGPV